jgi:hypothetical protein
MDEQAKHLRIDPSLWTIAADSSRLLLLLLKNHKGVPRRPRSCG